MILVDTSAWAEFFRGRGAVGEQVDALLSSNQVALCGPILTELRRGLRNLSEKKKVIPLLEACSYLSAPDDLWNEAGELGFLLARKGVGAKTIDLLIAVHALSHSLPLLTCDKDFGHMVKAGVPLALA